MSRINANTNKSLQCDSLGKKHSGKRYNPIYGTKYSRMDGGKFFKGCLPQILLGLFLNTLFYYKKFENIDYIVLGTMRWLVHIFLYTISLKDFKLMFKGLLITSPFCWISLSFMCYLWQKYKFKMKCKWFTNMSLWWKWQYQLFHYGGPYLIETNPLIYSGNQWTGFYMIRASIVKE